MCHTSHTSDVIWWYVISRTFFSLHWTSDAAHVLLSWNFILDDSTEKEVKMIFFWTSKSPHFLWVGEIIQRIIKIGEGGRRDGTEAFKATAHAIFRPSTDDETSPQIVSYTHLSQLKILFVVICGKKCRIVFDNCDICLYHLTMCIYPFGFFHNHNNFVACRSIY